MSKSVFQATVYFGGHVQGVGFRYLTLQIAKEFEVAGWVKNLADGRVQLECEGAQVDVEGFIYEVADRLDSYIRKKELTTSTGIPRYKGFHIA